jgi:hypothetical protein
MVDSMPRGVRNRNPGNIDRNATKWQGMADDQTSDPRFVVFKTPQYGIRAIARLMLTYQSQYGLTTIRGIVNRWAPPIENNTSAYVAAVAAGVGVGPDDPVEVDSCEVMLPLVKAIILHENGANPYPDSVILEGLHMAGVADTKPPPLAKKTTFQAQVGAGVAVIGAAGANAAQYAPTVKGWADKLTDYTGSPIIQHAATILLTIAGGLTLIGIASSIIKQRTA